MASQMARAIHSAWVKWPGKAGISFIRSKSRETRMPAAVTARVTTLGTRREAMSESGCALGYRLSTSQKERQAASQPRAGHGTDFGDGD